MANKRTSKEEQRIRAYIASQSAFSETAVSLANKLHVDVRTARRVLEELTEAGELRRRTFERHIEPVYYRFRERGA